MKKITQHAVSQLRSVRQPPASGQRPKLVTRQNVRTAVAELIDYHQQFEQFFQRHEQSDWSWFYLGGQLSNLDRKTIEPMVLSLLGAIPHAIRDLQRFISQSAWDVQAAAVVFAISGGEMVGRAGWGGDRGWEWFSQTRETLDWRGLSVLRSSWQDRELPGRCVSGVCQSARL